MVIISRNALCLISVIRATMVFAVGLLSGNAHSNDWLFEPSLSSSLTYTDNVDQEDRNANNDLVLSVTPGITFSKRKGRVDVAGRYSIQRTQYLNETDDDDTYHNLTSGIQAEIVRNNFFLDGNARVKQALIDAGRGGSSDNVSGSDNITTVASYDVGALYQTDIGDRSAFRARYSYNTVLYDSSVDDDEEGSDSGQHLYSLSLSSNNRPKTWIWALGATRTRTVYDTNNDQKVTIYTADLGYNVTRRLFVNGNIGYEEQDNDQDNLRDDPDGDFWSVGLAWDPTETTQIAASFGERYWGDTWSLSIDQQHKRNAFSLRYREEETDTRDQLAASESGFICPDNGTAADCRRIDSTIPLALQLGSGESVIADDSAIASIDDEIFISENWTATYIYSFKKSNFSLKGFHQKRAYQTEITTEKTYGINANYRLNHNEKTSSRLSFGYVKDELEDNLDNKTYSSRYSISRNVDPDTTINCSVAHNNRTSNEGVSEYTENRIVVGFLRSF